jgi:uncharacterized protein DUF3828
VKAAAVFLRLLSVSFIVQACSTTPVVEPQAQSSPEEVTRQFYDWYLRARFPDPKEERAKFSYYVTQRFLQQAIDEWDAVLFIAGQDADPSWTNHLAVSEAITRGDLATVEVALNGKTTHRKLRITLQREHSAWKIDNVKRVSWKAGRP